MGTLDRILREKQSGVASLGPQATVLEAAMLMNEKQIGSVLVTEQDRLAGIFTERDVLRRIVAARRDPATTPLAEVMTTPVACAERKTGCDEARRVMREKRIRHLPVVDEGRVVGIVSLGDLNKVDHEEQDQTIRYLEQYMTTM